MQLFIIKKIIIDNSQTNNRLDQALTNLVGKYSRSQIKILLQNNNVKISNKIITNASYKVKKGEIYYVKIPMITKSKIESQKIPLNIVYEDRDLLVINKPAGMVTHPAPGNQNYTLVNALLYHTKNNLSSVNSINRPGIIHRLDKDTSGLLIAAKNNLSHLDLSNQIKKRSLRRKYFAIVWGVPKNQIIKGYIGRHKKNRKKMVLYKTNNGKYSETLIKLKNSFGICSLIECTLKTGRTHQIRVHMNYINSPLIGDKLYGKYKTKRYNKNKNNYGKLLLLKNFQRQALHAYSISFTHPVSKKILEFKSKIPKDMLELLEFISKY